MTSGWWVYSQDSARSFQLEPKQIELRHADEALVSPVWVSWEGNMSHAVTGRPVDICKQRGEGRIAIGNSGVVIVDKCEARPELEGRHCIIHGAGEVDHRGHMLKAYGYDARGTDGLLGTKAIVASDQLMPLRPDDNLAAWSQFGVKYVTAWSSLHRALEIHHTMSRDCQSKLHVWGWGGGTTLAALQLAKIMGHNAVMIVGSPVKDEEARAHGVETVAASSIFGLRERKTLANTDMRRVKVALNKAIRSLTGENGVDIFFDFIGSPTLELSVGALNRYGVVASAGWKEGTSVEFNRAIACIGRQTHVFTHYGSKAEMLDAMNFARDHNWLPLRVVPFDYTDAGQLHEQFIAGLIPSYFASVKIQ